MELTIAIVNYNSKNLVKQCIKNIVSLGIPFPYQIIIIDNNSQDGSAEYIEKFLLPYFDQLKLVRADRNLGFGRGYNYGLKKVQSRYFLLMNADIVIQGDSLIKLHRFIEEDSRRGIVGAKLTYPDLTIQRSFHRWPTLFTPLYRRTPLGKASFGMRELNRYDIANYDFAKPISVDWVVGACMLIRKTVWDRVNGFDDRFFLYYEDIDICRKVWQAGCEVWFYPYTQIIHYHKRLSAQKLWWISLLNKTTRIHLSSHIKYCRKWGTKRQRSSPTQPINT